MANERAKDQMKRRRVVRLSHQDGYAGYVERRRGPEDVDAGMPTFEPLEPPKNVGLLKSAFRGWRAKRKVDRMSNPISKPIVTSTTTQNVAAGAAAGAGTAYGVIVFARNFIGLPWDESQDQAIAAVATVVLTPLISRLLAKWRKG